MPDLDIFIFWDPGRVDACWVACVHNPETDNTETLAESSNWNDCAQAVVEFLQQDSINL